MTETRRQALKILGAISASCAFPFAGDELYGQHVHSPPSPAGPASANPPGTAVPAFFTTDEYATLSRLADVIVPPTDTPGAVGAGVPEYIDRVVSLNVEHQALARAGLDWLDRESRRRVSLPFVGAPAREVVAMLQPLSDEVDRDDAAARQARFRADATGRLVYHMPTTDRTPPARDLPDAQNGTAPADDPRMPVRFFRLMKNLTADGYYTSRVGLLDELRYVGNTALAEFPRC